MLESCPPGVLFQIPAGLIENPTASIFSTKFFTNISARKGLNATEQARWQPKAGPTFTGTLAERAKQRQEAGHAKILHIQTTRPSKPALCGPNQTHRAHKKLLTNSNSDTLVGRPSWMTHVPSRALPNHPCPTKRRQGATTHRSRRRARKVFTRRMSAGFITLDDLEWV